MWLVWTALGIAALATPAALGRRLWVKARALAREIGQSAALVGAVFDAGDDEAPAPQVATMYDPATRSAVRAERTRLRNAKRGRREARLAAAVARWERYGLVGRVPVTMGGRTTGGTT